LAGNVGSGTPRELDEWVQYVNYKPGSPMADLRVKNGRKSPWMFLFGELETKCGAVEAI